MTIASRSPTSSSPPSGLVVTANPAQAAVRPRRPRVRRDPPSRGLWGGTLPVSASCRRPATPPPPPLVETMAEAVLAASRLGAVHAVAVPPDADTTPPYALTYPATIPNPNC